LQIEEFKAKMKNFKKLQGKAGIFGRINRRSKAMKEKGKAKKSKYLKGKKYKEIIAKKRRKRNKKREELRKNEGNDESIRCSIYWMIELKMTLI